MTGSLVISRSVGQSFYLGTVRVTLRAVVSHRAKLAIDSTPPVEAWCDGLRSVQVGESRIVVGKTTSDGSKARLQIVAPKSVKIEREEIAGVGNG